MEEVNIVRWDDAHKEDWIELSLSWLKKHDMLEEKDLEMIHNPYDEILNDGGMIFFAKYKDEVVGTVSMVRQDETTFELAKLGVSEEYQSLGVGKKLMECCFDFAKHKNAKQIILFNARELESAVGLYEKYGFHRVPMEDPSYEEVDIKMVRNV